MHSTQNGYTSRGPAFDHESILELSGKLITAVTESNTLYLKLATEKLSGLTTNQRTETLISQINVPDISDFEENATTFLKATDAIISATEEFPGITNPYNIGASVAQLFLALKYRFESAEKAGKYLEAAVSAEMAAHLLERAAKVKEIIEHHAAISSIEPDTGLVYITLEGILSHHKDTVRVFDNGLETIRHTGARNELLEAAGDNYDIASREAVKEHMDPHEAATTALELRAIAAVLLKEAGVSRRIRFKALGDCNVLAQEIVAGEPPQNNITMDLHERTAEITRRAIDAANARLNELRFAAYSVDGILRA